MRMVASEKFPKNTPKGNPFRKSPSANMIAARRRTCRRSFPLSSPCYFRFANDSVIATPTIQRKNGNIQSVNVHPFHRACSSCG